MSNGVILQPFHWYSSSNALYKDLIANAANLANLGYTAIWFPPPGKGSGGINDVGYGSFDLFDIGEFDQKQTIGTKYGTRAQLLAAIKAVQAAAMHAYIDVTFNHKDGGDDEPVVAQQVDWNQRNNTIGDWHTIKAYTRFEFDKRGGAYSTMKWHWYHFDAVSYDGNHP